MSTTTTGREAQIEKYAESVETGKAFQLTAAHHRSAYGYQPPLRSRDWSHAMTTISLMAGEGDPFAQIARRIVGSVNLYATDSEAAAQVYEAAAAAIGDGYDDVIGRAAPDAGRFSDHQRAYTRREAVTVYVYLELATAPWQSGLTGLGWCAAAVAENEHVRVLDIARRVARVTGDQRVAQYVARLEEQS